MDQIGKVDGRRHQIRPHNRICAILNTAEYLKSSIFNFQSSIYCGFLLIFASAIMLVLLPVRIAHAQQEQPSSGEQVVVCMIRLEHADAENLAAILKPFLSPQGSIAAYAPTNTLIIKDRASIVDMLAEIIKGKTCTTDASPPSSN